MKPRYAQLQGVVLPTTRSSPCDVNHPPRSPKNLLQIHPEKMPLFWKKNGDRVKLEVENQKWMVQLVSCEIVFLSIHTLKILRNGISFWDNEVPPPTTLTLGWTLNQTASNHQGRDIHPPPLQKKKWPKKKKNRHFGRFFVLAVFFGFGHLLQFYHRNAHLFQYFLAFSEIKARVAIGIGETG